MNKLLIYLILFSVFSACDLFTDPEDNQSIEIFIPDNTIFVSGVFTTSNDTMFYGAEVILARIKNDGGYASRDFNIPGSFWPIVEAQIVALSGNMGFNIFPEKEASIILTNTRTSIYKELDLVDEGVYADVAKTIRAEPGDSLTLKIHLTDDTHYFASTIVPPMPIFSFPDTLITPLKLINFNTNPATYVEQTDFGTVAVRRNQIKPFSGFNDGNIFEIRTNYEFDFVNFGFEKNDSLPNNWLRNGKIYGIGTYGIYHDSLIYHGAEWMIGSDYPIQNQQTAYLSVSQLDHVFSRNYQNVNVWVWPRTSNAFQFDPAFTIGDSLADVKRTNDNSFIFRVSNIFKMDKQGTILPKSESDAIGIFGSRSSTYRKTVLIPVRSWDPDTLNWAR